MIKNLSIIKRDPQEKKAPSKRGIRNFLRSFGIFLVMIGLLSFLGCLRPRFLLPANMINLLGQVAPAAIIAIGITYVLIAGGIDLSFASGIALCGVWVARTTYLTGNFIIGAFVGIALGAGIGAANGLAVSLIGIAPFVVTLATMSIFQGVAFLSAAAVLVPITHPWYKLIGSGRVGPIPISALLVLLLYVAGQIGLSMTRFGTYVYAMGDNEESLKVTGVNLRFCKFANYLLCGIMTGIAGIVISARLPIMTANVGYGILLDVIAGVVIGGTSLKGGRGSLIGTIVGVFTMGMISSGLNFLGIRPIYADIVKGGFIVGVLSLNRVLAYE